MFSGGKDSIVLLRLAEKAFRPGALPVPGAARRHRPQLPRGARVHRPPGRRARRAPDRRAKVAGLDRRRPRARGVGPRQARHVAQPAADASRCSTRSSRAASTPRSAARAATRSAPARRSGSSPSATTSASGTRAPSGPELWNLYNGRIRRGEHVRVFPLSNWTELDVWHYIEQEELELPSIYFAHEREVFEHDGMLYASRSTSSRPPSRSPSPVRYRTVGDMTITGAVRSERAPTSPTVIAEIAGHADHRARRDARRRPHVGGRHGRPQAPGLLLDDGLRRQAAPAPGHGRLGRRRQVDADRAAAARRQAAASTTRSTRCTATARTARPTSRRSPTACAPSASRASRSTSPTATSRRRGARSSSPTRPGHERYTRNMVTGASTAHLAVILIDARHGIIEQSRRHADALLAARHPPPGGGRQQDGPRRLGRGAASARSRREFGALAGAARRRRRARVPDLRAARRQRRRARASADWYDGPPLLEHLEQVDVAGRPRRGPAAAARAVGDPARGRRARRERRYAGQVAGGTLRPGDEVVVAARPASRTTVTAVETFDGPLRGRRRRPTRSRVQLADDLDVGRGEMIVRRRATCRPPAATSRRRSAGCRSSRCARASTSRSSTRRARCAPPSSRSTRCST